VIQLLQLSNLRSIEETELAILQDPPYQ